MTGEIILLRYGEVGLKGKNRDFFESILVQNVNRAVGRLDATVKNRSGRIVVHVPAENAGAALDALSRVFGIVSVSPAVRTALEPGEIERAALEAVLREAHPPFTFKVEAKRAEKRFPLTSPEINRAVGTFILDALEREGVEVDVHNPQVTVHIDVRSDGAYVFCRVISGPGGLPLGASGKGLLLLSGGIDSPVAGWYMMKRGIALEAIHFHSFPYTSEKARQKAVDLSESLSRWGLPVPLHICQFAPIQEAIGRSCPDEMITIVMRRMMFRIAERVARRRECQALITGESVGQVASQTLESMNTIGRVTGMTVLRPLCGLDKLEIIDRARRIGTFDISTRPFEDCCAMFVPRNPRTKPRPEQAEEAEARMDVTALVEEAVEGIQTLVSQGG
ncbi:MAG: tRNA uracil 4-sulfurtransferase ThiI [Ignavibacteriales bacterium]